MKRYNTIKYTNIRTHSSSIEIYGLRKKTCLPVMRTIITAWKWYEFCLRQRRKRETERERVRDVDWNIRIDWYYFKLIITWKFCFKSGIFHRLSHDIFLQPLTQHSSPFLFKYWIWCVRKQRRTREKKSIIYLLKLISLYANVGIVVDIIISYHSQFITEL